LKHQRHRHGLLTLHAVALLACQPAPGQSSTGRYLVTANAIDVGVGPGLCVAVDPADEHGVWWWEPGATGCDTRSTGPGLFQADRVVVPRAATGSPLVAPWGQVLPSSILHGLAPEGQVLQNAGRQDLTPESATFRLGTHSASRPFVDVRLVVEGDSIRAVDTGARATLVRRADLEVPEKPGPVRR
jgi:hypothetical protein